MNTHEERLIHLPEVIRLSGLSRSSVLRRIAANQFPPPIKLGRANVWSLNGVRAWIQTQIEGKNDNA